MRFFKDLHICAYWSMLALRVLHFSAFIVSCKKHTIEEIGRHIYSDACAQKEKHLRVVLRHWHKLRSMVTLYMKYYSQIYCSPRAIGDGNQKSDTAIIGRRHIASDSAISFQEWLTTVCVVTRRDCRSHSSQTSCIVQQACAIGSQNAYAPHACMLAFECGDQGVSCSEALNKPSQNSYRGIFSVIFLKLCGFIILYVPFHCHLIMYPVVHSG